MTNNRPEPRFTTPTELLRYQTRGLMAALGAWGRRLGVHPNVITVVALLPAILGALLAGTGQFAAAGIALLVSGALDALDGAIARATNRVTRFGALLDSTLDRYSDGLIFFGLVCYFGAHGLLLEMALAVAALTGAYAVSYVRARAEGLDIGSIRDGLFDRLVRTLVLIAALITGLIVPGLIVLAVGSHLTALQRLAIAYRATRDDVP